MDKTASETVKYPAYNGITLAHGDITNLYVDCLVCHLTNGKIREKSEKIGETSQLRGLLGSIAESAGPKFLKAVREELDWKTIAPGNVKFTKGFSSRAFEIFHCQGPSISSSQTAKESDKHLLSVTVENALDLAVKHNHVSIAFPAMLTGNYKFDNYSAFENFGPAPKFGHF